jgi:uncharacterized protein (TIGR00369 family)
MDEAAARAAFEAALRDHAPGFGRFFLARLLDLDISYGDETCRVKLPVQEFMYNPQGTLHGGIIAMALDISMGHLLNHVSGPGMTLEMQTKYLRAVKSGTVTCDARFLRRGRSINFLETRMTDEAGEAIAFATSTWRIL